jgi:hypothetical protein
MIEQHSLHSLQLAEHSNAELKPASKCANVAVVCHSAIASGQQTVEKRARAHCIRRTADQFININFHLNY